MNFQEYKELTSIAERGDSFAKNSLGAKLSFEGEKFLRASLYWYLEAVEDGFVESMWNAGTMLVNGEGCPKNEMVGLFLIETAAKNGWESACLFLSHCYEHGLHRYEIDLDEAHQWRVKAYDYDNENDFTIPIKVSELLDERPSKPRFDGDSLGINVDQSNNRDRQTIRTQTIRTGTVSKGVNNKDRHS